MPIPFLIPALIAGASALGSAGIMAGSSAAANKANKRQNQAAMEFQRNQAAGIGNLEQYMPGNLNQRITDALTKGSNIGFPAGYEERATSPFIAARETRFNENELPFMSGEYGGRGLGRSTLATRDIGKLYSQKENDINQMIANAYLNNLTQGKADTARYENLSHSVGLEDANLRLARAGLQTITPSAQIDPAPAALSTGLSTGLQTFQGMNDAQQRDRWLKAIEAMNNRQSASQSSPFTSAIPVSGGGTGLKYNWGGG